MQYRNLGKWGLKVSEIALGSWMTDLGGAGAAEVRSDEFFRAICGKSANFSKITCKFPRGVV